MKKLVTLVFIAATVIGLHAQEGATAVVLLNHSTLSKKVAKSDADIQDPKKSSKAATWQKRGELFQDVFMIGLEQTSEGMDPATLKLFYKEPDNVESETIEGALHETYMYENMDFTFVNGTLQQWKRKNAIHPSPLQESMKAYQKALELDEKGKLADKNKENMIELKNQMKRDGVNHYYGDDFVSALASLVDVLVV